MKRKHNKVTTGCLTCRKRRVKCDEGKPNCLNCSRNGRQCDGYVVRKPWIFDPKSRRANGPVLGQTVSSVIPILKTSQDQRFFQLYNESTAPQIAAFSKCSKDFWTYHTPQLMYSEPSVCHLALALAARQDAVESTSDSVMKFATAHCNKALQLLTKPQAGDKLEVMLVCCGLLGAYENMNPGLPTAEAMTHVIAALRILDNPALKTDGLIVNSIAPMFLQLEMVLSMFNTPHLGSGGLICPLEERIPYLPKRFDNLSTARYAFFEICRWRFKYEAQTSEWIANCAGFHEVKNFMLQWHNLLLEYIANIPSNTSIEAQQARAMMVQFRLLYLALYFSTQNQLPEQQRNRPTFVDLSRNDSIAMVFALKPGQVFNKDEWVDAHTTDPEIEKFKLWPEVEVINIPGQTGYLRFFSYAYGRKPVEKLHSMANISHHHVMAT